MSTIIFVSFLVVSVCVFKILSGNLFYLETFLNADTVSIMWKEDS